MPRTPAKTEIKPSPDNIPIGHPAPAQVTVPDDKDPAPTAREPEPQIILLGANRRLMYMPVGAKAEVFDGDAWVDLPEARPDGIKLRGYKGTGNVPEGYVRATDDHVLLWPTLNQEAIFRITEAP